MNKKAKNTMKNTLKLHPISTVLLLFYIVISLLQGTLGLFLMGTLAASAAYLLECMFLVTGMIRMRRYCAGHPRSDTALQRN